MKINKNKCFWVGLLILLMSYCVSDSNVYKTFYHNFGYILMMLGAVMD
jgi:hypothetical protein